MDFPSDPKACAVTDQFMSGPSILVAPVTKYRATSRDVYLPKTPGGWYSISGDKHLEGGQISTIDVSKLQVPILLRAGSIIPANWDGDTGERSNKRVVFGIVGGADADFTYYEDDGISNQYEHGASLEIPLHWDNKSQTLTVGTQRGTYKTAPKRRTFSIVRLDTHLQIEDVDYAGAKLTRTMSTKR